MNIPKVPLALEAPRMADHHIFPQQFRKFFEQRGINIDRFTVSVGEVTHLRGLHGKGNGCLPGKWNQRWRSFIEETPNASTSEVYQFGGKPMDEESKKLPKFKWEPHEVGTRHQLGGNPQFIQKERWPKCSSCAETMSFYGQLDSINDDLQIADCGMIYVFLCFDCNETISIIQSY